MDNGSFPPHWQRDIIILYCLLFRTVMLKRLKGVSELLKSSGWPDGVITNQCANDNVWEKMYSYWRGYCNQNTTIVVVQFEKSLKIQIIKHVQSPGYKHLCLLKPGKEKTTPMVSFYSSRRWATSADRVEGLSQGALRGMDTWRHTWIILLEITSNGI